MDGYTIKKGTRYFPFGGNTICIYLNDDAKIGKFIFKKGTRLYFKDNNLFRGTLVKDMTIGGMQFMAGSDIELFKNKTIMSGYLSNNVTIGSVTFQ